MKKILIVLVLVSIVLALSSCKEEATVSDYYKQYEGYVLEGYPEDLLPMYKMIAVDRCNLQVRDTMGNYINSYTLTYYTKASKNELKNFYKGILGENEYNSDDYIMGEKDGYSFSVSLQPREDDVRVVLTVELPKELSKDTNMFFKDFKRDLINKYATGDKRMIEESFTCTSNNSGQLEYFYVYEATTNSEKLEKELTEYYGGNNNFKVEKTVNGEPYISWTAGEYSVTFVYEAQYNQMNVSISEPMSKKS